MRRILVIVMFSSLLISSCAPSLSVTPTPYSVPPDCNPYCELVSEMSDNLFVFPLSFDGFDFFCSYKTNNFLSSSGTDDRWMIAFEYRRGGSYNQRLKLSISNAIGMKYQPVGSWKGKISKNAVVLNKFDAQYERLLSADGYDYCSLFWRVGDTSMLITVDACNAGVDDMSALTNNLMPVSQAKQMCKAAHSTRK